MSIVIGYISLFSSFISFISVFVPPIFDDEANRDSIKISALFLIAAAICFHG